MRRPLFLAAVAAAMLGAATVATAQEIAGPTPCCGKVCSGTTSTGCGAILPDGLGTLSGCVGVDGVVCTGGQFLDQQDSALIDGCTCVLGQCFGPLGPDTQPMTEAECTAAARAACEEAGNIVTTQNDAACGGGGGNENCTNGTDDDGDVDCDDTNCAGEPECQNGGGGNENCSNGRDDDGDGDVDCADSDCADNKKCQECRNRSGGGDGTNPGGHGNPAGCDNPGGLKKR
jgi:hypothetical protein